MKAIISLLVLMGLAAVLWYSGLLQPASRNILVSEAKAIPVMGGDVATTLTIENSGEPDRLVSVASTIGNARFEAADAGLPIQTGRSSLATDAAHVIVTPTGADLEDGALIPLTLTFMKAGDVAVKARFSPPAPGSMAAHMAMGHGSMTHSPKAPPFPSVQLTAARAANGWVARILVDNFRFSEELQDGAHVEGVGHGHLYLGGLKLGRVFDDTFEIGALPKGEHVLQVTLNTNDHRAYAVDDIPVAAQTVIVVD